VATFDTNHSAIDSNKINQSQLQSRSFPILLQSSWSAQLVIVDVSGGTVSLSISLKLAVDFVRVMYIQGVLISP